MLCKKGEREMRYHHNIFLILLPVIFFASLSANSITAYNNQTAYATQNFVFHSEALAQGFVRLNAGFTVLPQSCANMDVLFSVSGGIDLRETSTIRLLKDLEFDSGVTLTTGGNIDGRGHTLILDGNLTIPAGKVLHFNGNTIVDAKGHEIIIGQNAEIFIDTNVTLTIANAIIKTTRNAPTYPAFRCGALTSKLALDNVVFAPTGDFLFQDGQLFVHNDVLITGTSAFVYHSPIPSFIAQNSCLYIDPLVTLSIAPATFTDAPYALKNTYTNNNFIKMADETAVLYLNGCTLQTTNTGVRFTKGTITLDNKVAYYSDTTLTLTSITSRINQHSLMIAETVNWSPDGKFLAVAGNLPVGAQVQVYSFSGSSLTLAASAIYGSTVYAVNWSPDGKFLAVGGAASGAQVQVYSFSGSSLTLAASFVYGATVYAVNWSPDGKFLAVGGNASGAQVQVYSFSGSSLTLAASFAYGALIRSVNWSPDGKFLAVGSDSPLSGNEVQVFAFSGYSLSLVAFIDYGSSASSTVWSLNWSPDGRFLAIGGHLPLSGNEAQVYSFSGTSLTLAASVDYGTYVRSVNWSPDGRYLAIGGDHPISGQELQVYAFNGSSLTFVNAKPYPTFVNAINWRPDGKYLAIGGADNTFHETAVYKSDFVNTTTPQALTNSIVFGDSAKGTAYDVHLRLPPGASLNLMGKMLYDNVDGVATT